jgi:alpha 1,2-mannosyltransferase
VFAEQAVNPAFADDGSYTRAWTIPETKIAEFEFEFGADVDREFWWEFRWTACELEDKFASWDGLSGICEGVRRYWDAVFGGEVSAGKI